MWLLAFKKIFVKREFMMWSQLIIWPLYSLAFSIIMFGSYHGLYLTPADVTQGEVFRIIYIHVPMAALSMALYLGMCFFVLLERGWHLKMADQYALACAIVGSTITLLTIITGSIWAKPTWGTWWIWDARLTSEVILLVLFVSYWVIRAGIQPDVMAKEVSSYIALLGAINIPFIHYSVQWWYTLHQGPTILQFAKPKMPWIMLYPLICTGIGCILLCIGLVIHTAIVLVCRKSADSNEIKLSPKAK